MKVKLINNEGDVYYTDIPYISAVIETDILLHNPVITATRIFHCQGVIEEEGEELFLYQELESYDPRKEKAIRL